MPTKCGFVFRISHRSATYEKAYTDFCIAIVSKYAMYVEKARRSLRVAEIQGRNMKERIKQIV
jgi:hypothetical protein